MTKLEEKLIELGYKNSIFQHRYIKYYKDSDNYILIQLSKDNEEVEHCYTYCQSAFIEQNHIDSLQQAFNEMKKDLEILKGVEDDQH